jgi:hypothetical protein
MFGDGFIWLRYLDNKKIGAEMYGKLHMWCWRRMEKILEKLINEEVLGRIEDKRTILNNVLRKKTNWIGCILRRQCFFMMPLKDRWGNERSRKKNNTAL